MYINTFGLTTVCTVRSGVLFLSLCVQQGSRDEGTWQECMDEIQETPRINHLSSFPIHDIQGLRTALFSSTEYIAEHSSRCAFDPFRCHPLEDTFSRLHIGLLLLPLHATKRNRRETRHI